MRINVGQKISSIAVVTLALMLVVAVYSLRVIDDIAKDLTSIAGRQIPVAEGIARIEVHVLEEGSFLERLLVLDEGARATPEAIGEQRAHYAQLGQAVEQEFAAARARLTADRDDHAVGRHAVQAIDVMTRDIAQIESEHQALHGLGDELLDDVETGDRPAFAARMDRLDGLQDRVDTAIARLRSNADALIRGAVADADRDERALLITNGLLTALAALLGIGFSILVTRALVGAVRNLVTGTEAVEAGDLDIKLKARSRDEVGQLTGSFNTMVGGLRLKERIKETFGKYMDPRIVTNLLDNPEFAEPGGERREMTVLFVDLKGFTSIAERLGADDLVKMINGFFSHMTVAISDNAGVVDKFMGDAVMAYWGPPFTGADEHAALACKAALAALERLKTFRADVARQVGARAAGLDIDLRIGISTGDMVVGTIGSTASRSFTVMGDPVNLGSRLEGANKAYGTRIMISERTRELAGNAITVRELDLIRVKGKAVPTRVFELLTHDDNTIARRFEDGLAAYRAQDWDAAQAVFEACLKTVPGDGPSAVYLGRVAHLRAAPPPPGWDGVWVFETK